LSISLSLNLVFNVAPLVIQCFIVVWLIEFQGNRILMISWERISEKGPTRELISIFRVNY
jgi:hypothetical protein